MEAHRATARLSDPSASPDEIAAPAPSPVAAPPRTPLGVMVGDNCRRVDALGEASRSKSGSGSTLDRNAAWEERASCRSTCFKRGMEREREGREGEGCSRCKGIIALL